MHWRNASEKIWKRSLTDLTEFDNDSWYMHRKPSKQKNTLLFITRKTKLYKKRNITMINNIYNTNKQHFSLWLTTFMSKYFYILSDLNINVNKMCPWRNRIHLPMQGTRVQSVVWKDPTGHGETRPVHHDCWASAPEPTSCSYRAREPPRLKPVQCSLSSAGRDATSEKPMHHKQQ